MPNKDIELLRRQALDEGWAVVRANSGHYRFIPPPGHGHPVPDSGFITVGYSPSPSGVKNARRQLESAGLGKPSLMDSIIERSKEQEEDEIPNVFTAPDDQLQQAQQTIKRMTDLEILLSLQTYHPDLYSAMTDMQKAVFLESTRSLGNWYTDCICGSHFAKPLGLHFHLAMAKSGTHHACSTKNRDEVAERVEREQQEAREAALAAATPVRAESPGTMAHTTPKNGLERNEKMLAIAGFSLSEQESEIIVKLEELTVLLERWRPAHLQTKADVQSQLRAVKHQIIGQSAIHHLERQNDGS